MEAVAEATYWNGEPCEARKVTLVVADVPDAQHFWGRPFVGSRRDAVEVSYGGETFYLDDQAVDEEELPADYCEFMALYIPGWEPRAFPAGRGWRKVTQGHGSPHIGHHSVEPEPGSVLPR